MVSASGNIVDKWSCMLTKHIYSISKMKIFVPAESIDKFASYVTAAHELSTDVTDIVDKNYELIPVNAMDTMDTMDTMIELIIKNKKFQIEIIQCYHSVPCVGYGFIEKRLKLKPEYIGLTGTEITALKSHGININIEIEIPVFCFLGDTDRRVLNDNNIYKYKTIMIECTFINETELEQADKTYHMHWNYLKPVIEAHPTNTFILYHFSQRYTKQEIDLFFSQVNLTNVTIWNSN